MSPGFLLPYSLQLFKCKILLEKRSCNYLLSVRGSPGGGGAYRGKGGLIPTPAAEGRAAPGSPAQPVWGRRGTGTVLGTLRSPRLRQRLDSHVTVLGERHEQASLCWELTTARVCERLDRSSGHVFRPFLSIITVLFQQSYKLQSWAAVNW